MRTRSIALMLVAATSLASPALARFVVMDANFDGRTAGSQLGRGGAFQGEPVTGPWDRNDETIVAEGAGDMAVRFPDAQILGPSEMYFALRDDLAPVDGKLTARWTITPETLNEYTVSLRGADLETDLVSFLLTAAGRLQWLDADDAGPTTFAFYTAGVPIDYMVELDVTDGTWTVYTDGIQRSTGTSHGLIGQDAGSLVFGHPDDGNATGAIIFDDVQLDWRPGTAPWLLDADFSDKPVGEVIQTRGAFYGEPVSFDLADPVVEIGPPLGTKALVIEDETVSTTSTTRFEFLGGVEPANQPVSISFAIQVDQLEEYVVYIREQGLASRSFLSVRLRTSGAVEFLDAAGGAAAYHSHTYAPGVPMVVELHFEPVLDLYSVWWDGQRIIHRRAHGITDRDVGSVLFGHRNDNNLDGTLYVDRIRVHTLGLPLSVDDATTPAAPAVVLGAAPNPFNPATEIHFELPGAAPVTLDIFDGRGRLVRRLVDEILPAGRHRPVWRGADQQGRRVASGVYHARVTAGGFSATTSMTLVK